MWENVRSLLNFFCPQNGVPPPFRFSAIQHRTGHFCRFSSEIFFCFYFVPFSRASLPPFEWGQVSQNLGFCSLPPRVFFAPKMGFPPIFRFGVIQPRTGQLL